MLRLAFNITRDSAPGGSRKLLLKYTQCGKSLMKVPLYENSRGKMFRDGDRHRKRVEGMVY